MRHESAGFAEQPVLSFKNGEHFLDSEVFSLPRS